MRGPTIRNLNGGEFGLAERDPNSETCQDEKPSSDREIQDVGLPSMPRNLSPKPTLFSNVVGEKHGDAFERTEGALREQ